MLVCGLQGISTRLRELHPLLLTAAELRSLLAECKAQMSSLLTALQSARKTFVKLFAQFPGGGTSGNADAQFDTLKEALRGDLQVSKQQSSRL